MVLSLRQTRPRPRDACLWDCFIRDWTGLALNVFTVLVIDQKPVLVLWELSLMVSPHVCGYMLKFLESRGLGTFKACA